jgi:hypothetical protein
MIHLKMLQNIPEYLNKKSKLFLITSGLVSVLFIGYFDYLTGYEISFSLFYLLPIFLITWFVNGKTGVIISILSAISWLTADLLSEHHYTHPAIPYWNMSIRVGFFLIFTFLLAKLKFIMEEQARNILKLQKALAEINTLSGLLPICSSCKKIRDDKGYWNQLETYISEHSEAMFSHGICPECAKRLYPEYYKETYD